jgi:hypothetical protein
VRRAPVTIDDVCALIEEHGYEPAAEESEIALRNCPFHRLAQRHTDLVCTMNLTIFRALDAATDGVALEPRLAPAPGHCCVRLRNSAADGSRQFNDRVERPRARAIRARSLTRHGTRVTPVPVKST